MNIGIIELADTAHYTYVESIALIYSSNPDHQVYIFTTDKGRQNLQHLISQQIALILIDPVATPDIFSTIASFQLNKAYIVTLEPYTTISFDIAQQFLKATIAYPIHYVIHNIDFWFQQNIGHKIKQVIYYAKDIKSLVYAIKKAFYYTLWNKRILQKVQRSAGKLVVLSSALAQELKHYFPQEQIEIVPFSVYSNAIPDKSAANIRLRVCFPGYVSAIRRDYFSVLKMMDNEQMRALVEFDFLGGIAVADQGNEILALAKQYKAKGAIIHCYEKPSVNIVEFDQNLAKADIVLGNLHQKVGPQSKYGKSKESGLLFTMIKAAKPGIVPADYPCEPALQSSVLYFTDYSAAEKLLLQLAQERTSITLLKENAIVNSNFYTPQNVLSRLESSSL